MSFVNVIPAAANALLNDIDITAENNSLPADTTIQVMLSPETGTPFTDLDVSAPMNATVIISSSGATLQTITGHSPALTINPGDGNVVVENLVLATATSSPTVLVNGGSLTLRNVDVQQTSGSNAPAISIASVAQVDLGTASIPGGNVFEVAGSGPFIESSAGTPVPVIGDTFRANDVTTSGPVISLIPPTSGSYTGLPFVATATVAGVVAGVDDTPSSSLEGTPVVITYYPGTDTSGPGSTTAPRPQAPIQ